MLERGMGEVFELVVTAEEDADQVREHWRLEAVQRDGGSFEAVE